MNKIFLLLLILLSEVFAAQVCFAQRNQGYAQCDPWSFVPVQDRRRADGSIGYNIAPHQLSQYVESHKRLAQPEGVHKLNDVYYNPRSPVLTKQRRADVSSPTVVRGDAAPTVGEGTGTPVDQSSVGLNPEAVRVDPNVAPLLLAPPGSPQPVSVRQHYVHYNPGAFVYPEKPASNSEAVSRQMTNASPVMQYDDQDLATHDNAQEHSSMQSHTSKLNF